MAAQFRTEGRTDELIQGVADLDHKLHVQARETTVPGSQSSPRKPRRIAALPDSDSESFISWTPSPPRNLALSVEEPIEEEEDEDEVRGRSVRTLSTPVRGRSLSPRLYELIGRAFLQYYR